MKMNSIKHNTYRHFITTAAALALLASAGSARATLLAYEGFNYTAGSSLTNLGGGFGWSQDWQANSTHASNAFVVGSSFSYTDSGGRQLPTYGNRVHATGNGTAVSQTTGVGDNTGGNTGNAQPFRGLSTARGASGITETTWISFLALRTGNPDVTIDAAPNDYAYGRAASVQLFYNSVTSTTGGTEQFAIGRGTQSSETTNPLLANDTWAVLVQGNANATKVSSVNFAQSPADLLLVRIDHIGSTVVDAANADTLRMWINPDLDVAPSDASAAFTLSSLEFAGITRDLVFNRLRLFGGSEQAAIGYGSIEVDEIRIGEFFLDVVPEPSVLTLGVMGALALVLRRRK